MGLAIFLAERGWLPDGLVRLGIRRLLAERVRAIETDTESARQAAMSTLIQQLDRSPIALATDSPNRQHYEVPAELFRRVLGRHLKYSCGFWPAGTADLDAAEAAMLERTCDNAGLEDGMDILELGCGWGSLSLWMAERLPASRITAVSNSTSQKAFIDGIAAERGLDNIEVVTADMNDFDVDRTFDRVVSVEMFEHMRNYRELLTRVRRWLRPDGRLFVHIFCHRRYPYLFESRDDSDWMATHFFTAGLMPSDDLLFRFDDQLRVERHYAFSGEHYQRTAEAWLRRLDGEREAVLALFREVYGEDHRLWYHRWRIFFMACAELFGFHRGQEWWVSHYLLAPGPESTGN